MLGVTVPGGLKVAPPARWCLTVTAVSQAPPRLKTIAFYDLYIVSILSEGQASGSALGNAFGPKHSPSGGLCFSL